MCHLSAKKTVWLMRTSALNCTPPHSQLWVCAHLRWMHLHSLALTFCVCGALMSIWLVVSVWLVYRVWKLDRVCLGRNEALIFQGQTKVLEDWWIGEKKTPSEPALIEQRQRTEYADRHSGNGTAEGDKCANNTSPRKPSVEGMWLTEQTLSGLVLLFELSHTLPTDSRLDFHTQ